MKTNYAIQSPVEQRGERVCHTHACLPCLGLPQQFVTGACEEKKTLAQIIFLRLFLQERLGRTFFQNNSVKDMDKSQPHENRKYITTH